MNIGKLKAERSESGRGGGARIWPREKHWGLGAEMFLSHVPFRITVPFLEATSLCESYSNRRFSSLPYAVNCQNHTNNLNMNDFIGV